MYQVGIYSKDKGMSDKIERSILARYQIKVYKYVSENELSQEMGSNQAFSDILIMDIQHTKHCIQLAKNIQEKNRQVKVIFIAGEAMEAISIFEADPTYLLLKPVNKENLYHAMDKALQKLRENEELELWLYDNKRLLRIPYEDIFYIESDKRYLTIHRKDYTEKILMKLSKMMELLPRFFVRCHQSYAVNILKIVKFEKNEIIIGNGKHIPVSRSRQESTESALAEFGKEKQCARRK